jgi:hypothetical protein
MSGAAIIADLLRNDDALIAQVAAPNIKGGRLADDAPLNSLLVRSLTIVDRQTLAREQMVRSTERVSVTVRADSYRAQRLIIKLIRTACTSIVLASSGDARNISVLTAGAGPELNGPGNSFERNQDFYVSYDAPA